MKIDDVINEKVFELRKQGMSFQKIRNTLLEQFGKTLTLKTIRLRCKKMFIENGIEQPVCKRGRKEEWNQGEQSKEINNEIYKLKEQGYSYPNIARILNKKGIEINEGKVGRICRKIYAEKGKNIPKVPEASPIDREELYNLAERGLPSHKICEILKERGVEITISKLDNIMYNIYAEKGKKRSGGRHQNKDVTDEEIYSLKNQGKSLQDICEYYKSKGITIGEATIFKKAKRIFEEKGETMPKAENKASTRIVIPEIYHEKIYMLRQNNYSINAIIEKLIQEDGYTTTSFCVKKLLKKIYAEKGETEPKAKAGRKKKIVRASGGKKRISNFDEELYSLREQGYGIEAIREILEKEYNFKTGTSTICKRLKVIYGEKGKKEPRTSKSKRIAEQVCELREQGLKYTEITKKLYSDYGIKVSGTTVKIVCESVYGPATRKEIAEIGRLKKLEEEHNKLQQTKQESEQLLEQYKMLQNMKEDEQNARE